MSEMEAVKIELVSTQMTVQEFLETNYLNDKNEWEECSIDFMCELRDKYKVLNNIVYKVNQEEKLDECGFCDITVEEGVIKGIALWYNGGGSLEEVIEEKLPKE